ncbi:E3 ubiquitin-protein ligase UPL3-like [Phragmites australis]|uniref:E3 ubiquitin-protein ligase UPL3-like n=1 Tax=Phragmites australis TaxID=29695 RepID=UPI002D787A2D|nr:E3 ubiquitin-protein ligase UPL3-like [Phragmites australis]
METRSSRKRAAASSASKRSRPNSSAAPAMDPSPSSRRRSRSAAADKGKDPDPSPTAPAPAPADDDVPSPQSFTSASNALHGLLHRLGAGLDDLLPSSAPSSSFSASTSAHLKRILAGLQPDGDESRQLQSLMHLCEMLSIATEDSLAAFPVEAFVPILVGLLGREEEPASPDIMLLAARALANLVDVLPSSCSAVVHYGAIQCFCARLLTIEYMDLAEQSLQALKKISLEHPTACLRAGALMAVLSYLDFFSTGVQRVALSTAANICRKLPSDASEFVMEAAPLLTNLLNHHDSKVLEHASVCLTRIAEAFANYPEKLDEFCSHGLVAQAASLISIGNSSAQASLSTSTYTGLIRLLSICASGSLLAVKTLLLLGISGTLKDILSGSVLISGASVSPALTRPADQMFEIVSLADDLLPYMPVRIINLPRYYHAYKGSSTKKPASIRQDGASSTENDRSGRERLLREHPELLQQFGMDLLPTMTQVYGSSINAPIRHKCLSIIGKLMYYSSAETIQSLLGTTNISSFLAGILAWKDPQVLIPALQIAEIMMEKLPETFSKLFVREGVVHAVESLVCSEPLNTLPSQVSPQDRNNDPAMPSRSRRQRRRGGAVLTENSPLDESNGSNPGITCTTTSSLEVPNTSLHFSVSDHAKSFKDRYFPTDPDSSDIGVNDDLLKLRTLCAKLNTATENVKTKAKGKSKAVSANLFDISNDVEEQLDIIVSEMLAELSKVNGVSTFEFIRSGVVTALLDYLSCGTFGKERVSEANLPKLRQQALRRYKSFVSVALSIDHERDETPMALLVQKLQSALSSLERFPVVLSQSNRIGVGGSCLTSGLSALAQPFKLRLSRAQGEKSLRDYSSNIVVIDPFASLAAVEEFLWPKVQRRQVALKPIIASGNNSESGVLGTTPGASLTAALAQSGRRPTTRSKSSAASSGTSKKDSQEESTSTARGKGKAVVKPNSDEPKGPNTRNSACQKSASDKELEMKPAHGHSSSEDEELGTSPVEIDDTLMIDDDDISEDEDDHEVLQDGFLPICAQDDVHDVKLGDADECNIGSVSFSQAQPSSGSVARNTSSMGANSAEFRSASTFDSRGAMPFDAVTMSGLASVGGRSVRGGRDRHGLSFGGSMNENNKLIFMAGGKQLSKHLTVYQAVQRQLMLDEDDEERLNGSDLLNDGNCFWGDVFTITYQKADSQDEKGFQGGSTSLNSKSDSCRSISEVQEVSLLDSMLQAELPCDLDRTNSTYNILALLRVLEGLNQLSPRLRAQGASDDFAEGKTTTLYELYKTVAKVPSEGFVNSKLTPKLARQMQDVLALCSGSLPSWCYQMTKACPFLFPFETRRQYFYSTAFGLSRALNRLKQQQGGNHSSGVRFGRLQRQKVRVSRNRILDSAAKVMEMFSSQRAVLEVEYFGEVGTGLGPTLEFYTLLSHELQNAQLGLWRSNSPYDSKMQIDWKDVINIDPEDGSPGKELNSYLPGDGSHSIQGPLGLFPRPWPPKVDASEGSIFFKVFEYFRLIGRVMAKVLQDGRLLDLPLSTAFYKLILGQELDLFDIVSFDAELGKTLQELQVLVDSKRLLESTSGENILEVADLHFRGTAIEDLCLDFTLPGYPDYVLKEGEGSTIVNIYNLEEYITLVVDATVKSGIMRQVEAFRSGFNQVFDIASLQIFSPQELDYLICGCQEIWEPESLLSNIKFDHGYTAKSPAIINLLEIMVDFTPEQQHAFCQFVTGAPRLPPGGLAALSPKLTIVRKHPSSAVNTSSSTGATESADDDLPSVMTCANYLKLPPYSTKEIMRKKLLYAILEGRGSFDLS